MIQKTEWIWMNGRLVKWEAAKIHVLTHALHYGSGVFEGMRVYPTKQGPAVFRLDDHIKRLFRSASFYSMKIPFSEQELIEAAVEVVRENKLDSGYIRPIAFYGYGVMGLSPDGAPVEAAIAAWPWGSYLGEEGLVKGIRCKISSWRRIDPKTLPTQAKACGNYLNSILAKTEALRAGFDEAIMLNLKGKVAECSGENIFMVKKERLVTPPADAGVLEGITRDSVIRIAEAFGLKVFEKNIKKNEVFSADELFLTGTAAEVTPVREVDGRKIGSGGRGPITEKLQKKYFEVVRGEETRYRDWLTFVSRTQ
ncbi:branched-chain amino acid transaminase [Candidatus Micrarchaeota archaeon]|nr:branched-chain amino acid transaminase [Candidatus Micrarchaeota archaeon]